mgnify:CR=1 FL=1
MSDNVKQVRIQFIADTSKLKKGAEQAKDSLEGVKKEAEAQKGTWDDFRKTLDEIAPDIGKTADEAKQMGARLKDAFGGAGDGAKGFKGKLKSMASTFKKSSTAMKLGILGVVVAVGLAVAKAVAQVAKMVWDSAKETARAYNSQKYDTAVEKRQSSTRKLKTAVGAFTSPVVNGINTAISAILDGVTWVVKKLHAWFSLLAGIVKGIVMPIIDGIKAGIDAIAKALTPVFDAIKNGINAIAGFFGFGDVFKKTTEGAKEASEAVEKVGEESEYAEGALQSFDKLNTMDAGTGDQDTADEIDKASNKWQEIGESGVKKLSEAIRKLPQQIKDALKGLPSWFKTNIIDRIASFDWGGLYGKLCETLGRIPQWFKDNVVSRILAVDWRGLYDGFCQTVGPAGQWFKDNVLGPILSFDWKGLYDGFCQTMGGIYTWLLDTLDPILSFDWGGLWDGFCDTMKGVGTWISEKLSAVLSFDWGGLWSGFCETLGGIPDWIQEKLSSVLSFDWSGLWEGFKETMKKIASFLTDQIKAGIDGAVGGILSFAEDPIGGITSIPGKLKGALGLADGGVVKPNDPFPVIVGDNTREPEVISPLSTMKTAFKEAMSEMSVNSGTQNTRTEIVLQVDGKTLARATYDDLMAEGARRGRGTIA